MKTDRTILTVLVAVMLASCGQRQAVEPAVFKDIIFAQAPTADGGSKDLKMNIWKGAGDDPQPPSSPSSCAFSSQRGQ